MRTIVSQDDIQKILDEKRLRNPTPAASRNLDNSEDKLKSVPDYNIEKTIHKVNMLRDRMKDTSGYLALYYDLKEAEGQFMKEVEVLERKGFTVSEQTLKRVNAMKDRIMKNKP